MHYNYQDVKISPITIEEASGAAAAVKKFMRTGGHQVKGKQVEGLCDLVTVSREYKAMRERAVTEKTEQPDRTVLKYLGRRLCVMICESGNLPECWYRKKNSRSRGIDRTVYMSADSSGHLFLMLKHSVFEKILRWNISILTPKLQKQ